MKISLQNLHEILVENDQIQALAAAVYLMIVNMSAAMLRGCSIKEDSQHAARLQFINSLFSQRLINLFYEQSSIFSD